MLLKGKQGVDIDPFVFEGDAVAALHQLAGSNHIPRVSGDEALGQFGGGIVGCGDDESCSCAWCGGARC